MLAKTSQIGNKEPKGRACTSNSPNTWLQDEESRTKKSAVGKGNTVIAKEAYKFTFKEENLKSFEILRTEEVPGRFRR